MIHKSKNFFRRIFFLVTLTNFCESILFLKNYGLFPVILERLNSLIILKTISFYSHNWPNGSNFINLFRYDVNDQIIGVKKENYSILQYLPQWFKSRLPTSEFYPKNHQKPRRCWPWQFHLTPSGIPNLAKISNTIVEGSQTNIVQSLCKPKICKFLMKHCFRLITEDVMCNKAFIECLSCSVENIMSHEKQKRIYEDKTKRRKPITEL